MKTKLETELEVSLETLSTLINEHDGEIISEELFIDVMTSVCRRLGVEVKYEDMEAQDE